jgi:hypothetical protein
MLDGNVSILYNGHQRASGGPTFTGCQQPIGQDWFTFGHLPSTWTLDGNA